MRLIATEEHFALPPVPGAPAPAGKPPLEEGTMVGAPGSPTMASPRISTTSALP